MFLLNIFRWRHISDTQTMLKPEMVLSIIETNINRLKWRISNCRNSNIQCAQRNLIKSKIEERKSLKKFSDFNEKIQN
jgi:hypothetical protein